MRTMDEVFDRFVKEHLPTLRKATQHNYRGNIETLRSFFGKKNVKAISRSELQQWMNVQTGKMHRNRLLAILSSAMGDAVKWGWIDANVCKEIDRHKGKKGQKIVSEKELEGIKKKAGKRMSVAVDLCVLTGLSQTEILSLTWENVDEDDNVIRYKHSRTGQPARVEITPKIREVLLRAKQLPSAKPSRLVLPTSFGKQYSSAGFRAAWQDIINAWDEIGNERFTFNDLQRHGLTTAKKVAPPRRAYSLTMM